jgi:Flp pilus assembly protein TadG
LQTVQAGSAEAAMALFNRDRQGRSTRPKGLLRLFVRLRRNEDGVAAIEFALLAVPFFMLLFAIIESCIAFAAEQVLENAVDTMGRQVRTGEITFEMDRETDMTEAEFKTAFCDHIRVMLSCDDDTRLFLDVRAFNNFNAIPRGIPRMNNAPHGDLDTAGFDFKPGGAKSINMVRAYYKWPILTDLVRPYITNIRPDDGSMPSDYLIVGTSAFRNEAYP